MTDRTKTICTPILDLGSIKMEFGYTDQFHHLICLFSQEVF